MWCLCAPSAAAADSVAVLLFAAGVRGQPPAFLPGTHTHKRSTFFHIVYTDFMIQPSRQSIQMNPLTSLTFR